MKNFKLTTKDCAILITLLTIFAFICFSFTVPATDYKTDAIGVIYRRLPVK